MKSENSYEITPVGVVVSNDELKGFLLRFEVITDWISGNPFSTEVVLTEDIESLMNDYKSSNDTDSLNSIISWLNELNKEVGESDVDVYNLVTPSVHLDSIDTNLPVVVLENNSEYTVYKRRELVKLLDNVFIPYID